MPYNPIIILVFILSIISATIVFLSIFNNRFSSIIDEYFESNILFKKILFLALILLSFLGLWLTEATIIASISLIPKNIQALGLKTWHYFVAFIIIYALFSAFGVKDKINALFKRK